MSGRPFLATARRLGAGNCGSKEGDGEGHSRRAQTLPHRNDNGRLHAGDSGERAEDGRRRQCRASTPS
jgi:hypothetical protein